MSLTARLTALEQRLDLPKTPDNSSLPPSKGQKPNRSDPSKPAGPRKGSLGRKYRGAQSKCGRRTIKGCFRRTLAETGGRLRRTLRETGRMIGETDARSSGPTQNA